MIICVDGGWFYNVRDDTHEARDTSPCRLSQRHNFRETATWFGMYRVTFNAATEIAIHLRGIITYVERKPLHDNGYRYTVGFHQILPHGLWHEPYA